MNGLSDLELVAQAMGQSVNESSQARPATTQPVSQPPQSQPAEPSLTSPAAAATDNRLLDLSSLDLSSLSLADRAAIQPILDALVASAGADGDIDIDVDGILAQMDAADGVADALEERLDKLLESLGRDQAGLEDESK
ncbi:hypothetical protein Q5752_002836 [Cryptotrichosporon argae]